MDDLYLICSSMFFCGLMVRENAEPWMFLALGFLWLASPIIRGIWTAFRDNG